MFTAFWCCSMLKPSIGHAVKKLLCAGKRGAKDYRQDLIEAKAKQALIEKLAMMDEKPNIIKR